MLFMFLEQRTFWALFGIAFCVLTLYGPWVGPPDNNGYRYLLAPLLCPMLPALYYLFRPLNPYKGPAARLGGMTDFDKSDNDAARLVQLFSSKEARDYLWQTAMKISAVLFAIMAVITIACRNSLNWSFPSPWLGQGVIGCCIGSFITLGTEYVRWSLGTWANQVSD
jgi:hypothetical protein